MIALKSKILKLFKREIYIDIGTFPNIYRKTICKEKHRGNTSLDTIQNWANLVQSGKQTELKLE